MFFGQSPAALHPNPHIADLWPRSTVLDHDRILKLIHGEKGFLRWEAWWIVQAGEDNAAGEFAQIRRELESELDPASGETLWSEVYPLALEALPKFPGPDPNVPPPHIGPQA